MEEKKPGNNTIFTSGLKHFKLIISRHVIPTLKAEMNTTRFYKFMFFKSLIFRECIYFTKVIYTG